MSESNIGTVYIVEDDASVRDAVGLLLGIRGYSVSMFADAESFLHAIRDDWSGCLLIDIRMPGMDGLSLQQHLVEIGFTLPAIIMTGHGDVESAREAFRAHAVDFLEKPIDRDRLISAIEEAFRQQSSSRLERERQTQLRRQLSNLTTREREVMNLVVSGKHNREIAESLGISVRTVEVHKSRIMSKLGVSGVPQLVRLSLGAVD